MLQFMEGLKALFVEIKFDILHKKTGQEFGDLIEVSDESSVKARMS